MVQSVRVSSVCALIVLALSVAPACGGGDDDDSAGQSGKGGSSGGSAGKGSAGSTPAGTGGDSKVFDAGNDPTLNDVTAGEICDRAAAVLCAGEAYCCDDPGETVDECKTAMLKTCNNNYMLDAIAMDARVGFDAAGASASFKMLEERASKCDPSVTTWAASPEGFATSFHGTLAMGEDCTPKGGAMNASVAELLTALASCSTAAGACMPSATTWKCEPRSSKGGKCGTDANCAEGMHCNNTSEELDGSGTCVDRKPGGETCTDASECASYTCTGGKCAADSDVQAAYCLN